MATRPSIVVHNDHAARPQVIGYSALAYVLYALDTNVLTGALLGLAGAWIGACVHVRSVCAFIFVCVCPCAHLGVYVPVCAIVHFAHTNAAWRC